MRIATTHRFHAQILASCAASAFAAWLLAGLAASPALAQTERFPVSPTGIPYTVPAAARAAGRPLPDSQSGFRLMNLDAWSRLQIRSTHFEIESELLLGFVAAGLVVESVPIQVIYNDERSKIRPLHDTIRWFRWWRGSLAERVNMRLSFGHASREKPADRVVHVTTFSDLRKETDKVQELYERLAEEVARSDQIGDLQPERRFPKHAEILSIERRLGDHLNAAQVEVEPPPTGTHVGREGERGAVRRGAAKVLDARLRTLAPRHEPIERRLLQRVVSHDEMHFPRPGDLVLRRNAGHVHNATGAGGHLHFIVAGLPRLDR